MEGASVRQGSEVVARRSVADYGSGAVRFSASPLGEAEHPGHRFDYRGLGGAGGR
jgi:hypothetical protein